MQAPRNLQGHHQADNGNLRIQTNGLKLHLAAMEWGHVPAE